MSVPIAVVGLIPKISTSRGVIREPPPMPVMPTRKPTPKPKKTIAGSMGSRESAARDERRYSHFLSFYDRNGPKWNRARYRNPSFPPNSWTFSCRMSLTGDPGAFVPGQLQHFLRDLPVTQIRNRHVLKNPAEGGANRDPDVA